MFNEMNQGARGGMQQQMNLDFGDHQHGYEPE
jgi:protein lifeguard